jgi:predicted RNA-binding protein YlxR (DUF448 family)
MLARADHRETDTGPKMAGSERMCALTRQVKPADELIRFVAAPDGSVVADLKRKLPGRGIWITATRDALADAIKRKVFARGLKANVHADSGLIAETERLLERAVLDALSIAGKAGAVVSGFAKVEAATAGGRLAALIHARDAASDGVRKLDAALHRETGENGRRITVINDFSTGQLDLALGRSNVVHAGLLAGPAGNTFIARYLRLKRFRTGGHGKPDHDGAQH